METPKHFQVITEDSTVPPQFDLGEAYAWACGYNAALIKTNALELLEALTEAIAIVSIYTARAANDGSVVGNTLNKSINAIKKATE